MTFLKGSAKFDAVGPSLFFGMALDLNIKEAPTRLFENHIMYDVRYFFLVMYDTIRFYVKRNPFVEFLLRVFSLFLVMITLILIGNYIISTHVENHMVLVLMGLTFLFAIVRTAIIFLLGHDD